MIAKGRFKVVKTLERVDVTLEPDDIEFLRQAVRDMETHGKTVFYNHGRLYKLITPIILAAADET